MTASNPVVLVVEDEEDTNELLRYSLALAGYQPLGALDGSAALAGLRERRPDLILLDLGLPGVSGWDLCRILMEDEQLRHVPVVIFTAKGSRDDFDRGLRFPNVYGYFVKPYAAADVIAHIARVLDGQR